MSPSALYPTSPSGCITDVPGIRAGHFTDSRRPTGCTALLLAPGSVTGLDVRGGASGLYGAAHLDPLHSVEQTHALFLSGGSEFGLQVGIGVTRYLEQNGQGFHFDGYTIPLVAGAILYDLQVGDGLVRPDAEAGYLAASSATTHSLAVGNVGAGAGATVGKLFGIEYAMKSGLGTASISFPSEDIVVGAVVAVNAAGDIFDHRSGKIIAGALDRSSLQFLNTTQRLLQGECLSAAADKESSRNTTIAVIATNATLSRAEITRVARMAHAGMCRSISPVHTHWDGDAIFAVATRQNSKPVSENVIGVAAAEVLSRAITCAVDAAKKSLDFPARSDLR